MVWDVAVQLIGPRRERRDVERESLAGLHVTADRATSDAHVLHETALVDGLKADVARRRRQVSLDHVVAENDVERCAVERRCCRCRLARTARNGDDGRPDAHDQHCRDDDGDPPIPCLVLAFPIAQLPARGGGAVLRSWALYRRRAHERHCAHDGRQAIGPNVIVVARCTKIPAVAVPRTLAGQTREVSWCPSALRTTFVQSSSLCLNISKPCGASCSGSRWLITKLGSISPRSMRSSSGRM